MATFEENVAYAAAFCVRRAGTGNSASTRALCNCVEHERGEEVIAQLIRKAHKRPRLAQGVRLLFNAQSLMSIAKTFGVDPLPIDVNRT